MILQARTSEVERLGLQRLCLCHQRQGHPLLWQKVILPKLFSFTSVTIYTHTSTVVTTLYHDTFTATCLGQVYALGSHLQRGHRHG